MDYLCIWNAFEQNSLFINHIKEIGRLAAAAAVSQQPSIGGASVSASATSASTSEASSTASSPTAVSKESAAATTSAFSSTQHFPASPHVAALAAAQQQLQQRIAAAAYQQGQAELPAQSPMFINQQQMPGAAHQQQPGTGVGLQQLQQNNSNMANSLLWQPWRDLQQAAAMHHQLYKQQQQQQLFKETRLTSKELPTNKWRRERRQRAAAAEYQVHDSNSEREREREPDMDSPIDMTVTSNTVKHQRASPPPPYREPLAGGANSHCYVASRPSVITQAPPKRELPKHSHQSQHHHHHSHSSHEHDHRSTESDPICDIDEHFRRSLGPGYAALLKSPASSSPTPSPQPLSQQQPQPAQALTQLQSAAGNGTPMQQISPQAYRQQPTAITYEHQSQLPLPLPLSKLGLPIVHSPTLQPAPISPQHELPPPQKEPLSLSPPPARSASALSCSPPPLAGASQILDAPATKREKALDTPHHTPPRCNTPPPAYASVMASTPTMPAIIRVKAEPGLAAASSTQTPPASPTSSTNISIFTKTEASVDDHFAKALGDTWKKLQAHKE
ncbi:arginine-glutamic acid dipeptide repeats protein isoform X1 [Drosophila mojavensis]|uniref:Uncharacterized protein, isoform B n=1 Tax=Drosophila mojavensis TaxID=7230 RepID=A0A0Q9XDU3_DROMO|nr:arginine-glutamic acid dipeptide repeats protein isoform X1 [Drosophila mojavensis]KRG06758.1 uncharacterized protein Dmoj_GI13928, isoform B [Drosophila mojavensis]